MRRGELHFPKKQPFSAGKINMEENLPEKGDVPTLISAYTKGTKSMRIDAHKSLMILTARDFGPDAGLWKKWYSENRDKSVKQWRTDGLRDAGVHVSGLRRGALTMKLIEALMHPKRCVREAVYAMLKEMHGPLEPYSPYASPKVRRRFYRRWLRRFGES